MKRFLVLPLLVCFNAPQNGLQSDQWTQLLVACDKRQTYELATVVW